MTIPVNIQRSISALFLKNKFYFYLGDKKGYVYADLSNSVNNSYHSLNEEISVITASIRNKVNEYIEKK